ncbi:11989_t:CDS:2, partial [Racocetra persica]
WLVFEILQKEKLDLSDFTSLEELKCGELSEEVKNKARQELRKEKEASEQLRTQMEKEKNELTAQLTTEQQTNKQLQEQLSKQPTPTTQQSLLKTLAVYGFLLSLLGNWL